MGSVIVREVILCLEQNGIAAEQTRPGRKYPQITGPVAAVHVLRAEPDRCSATVEIHVVCPGSMGSGECEAEGLRICGILQEIGAKCVQNGYHYEGMARIGHVSIEATFTGWEMSGEWIPGPGFQVLMERSPLPWVIRFWSELAETAEPEYEMDSGDPARIAPGSRVWNIQLEQLIPLGHPEEKMPQAPFEVLVEREGVNIVYEGCRWTGVSREYTPEGLRRCFTGLATGWRQEE